jgi:excisionase family DNA binding protein
MKGVRTGQVVFKPTAREQLCVDDIVFTAKEVAARLKMHPDAVRRLIYAGQLQAFYLGGRRIRITERHIEAFLTAHARPT